ncbi:adenylyl-sulfate kinase CysC [Gottschalkia acidurici 9a]|uniref:Adenylyl-sulfate kinase n=1 Tax=Gottschalkia acidurici (strain ATCC 7906 / DSM 604 / BCRC 14475 / CIP 104303 / KCTC 5404 / NCIMB 10678 / 9a) TaxID=1128398 RepID=K0B4N5_GOTA9|nr:adenylyl-sulfate kinase [Gottschalkia acidurici]AFS79521.1 adenylyl-sulfate kinase CysC [Gottschalkia acidurici 9a]
MAVTSDNVVWHSSSINREDREELLGQRGTLIWFTGLSGSGKSTIANALQERLYKKGKLTYVLDGDNIRHGLNGDLGFSLEDRKENIRRIGEVGKLFVDSGIITLGTFVSPLREDRLQVRNLLKQDFIEVYIKCSLETCEQRDPKNLYKKARNGEIKDFTGIDSPYEEPENPEIILETDVEDIDTCIDKIIEYLELKENTI